MLLPLYALALKLAYWRRYYIEHLVMSVHAHVVLLLAVGLGVLLPGPAVVVNFLQTVLVFALVAWQLFALRTVYGVGWPGTVLRFGLLAGAWVLLFLAAAGLLLLYTLSTF